MLTCVPGMCGVRGWQPEPAPPAPATPDSNPLFLIFSGHALDPDAGGQRPRQQSHGWCPPPDAHSPTPGGTHPSRPLPGSTASKLNSPWAWPSCWEPTPHESFLREDPCPSPSPTVPSGIPSRIHVSLGDSPQARDHEATGRRQPWNSSASTLRTHVCRHCMSIYQHTLGHVLCTQTHISESEHGTCMQSDILLSSVHAPCLCGSWVDTDVLLETLLPWVGRGRAVCPLVMTRDWTGGAGAAGE